MPETSDEEKYVTLTEALEWEKRVRAEMSDDELYEALREARRLVEPTPEEKAANDAANIGPSDEWVVAPNRADA